VGRAPTRSRHPACIPTIADLVRSISSGDYRFDRMVFNGPFDILGFFLGYMSGPIIEESSEERETRQSRIVTLPEEPCPTGIAS